MKHISWNSAEEENIIVLLWKIFLHIIYYSETNCGYALLGKMLTNLTDYCMYYRMSVIYVWMTDDDHKDVLLV